MHNTDADGNEFFLCDFCHSPWAEDRPMVEGHRGSLICARCLTLAFRAVIIDQQGEPGECALCLQFKEEPCWVSPVDDAARACYNCIAQSARMLEKDKDYNWHAPKAPGA
jgi:hypothetical protein